MKYINTVTILFALAAAGFYILTLDQPEYIDVSVTSLGSLEVIDYPTNVVDTDKKVILVRDPETHNPLPVFFPKTVVPIYKKGTVVVTEFIVNGKERYLAVRTRPDIQVSASR